MTKTLFWVIPAFIFTLAGAFWLTASPLLKQSLQFSNTSIPFTIIDHGTFSSFFSTSQSPHASPHLALISNRSEWQVFWDKHKGPLSGSLHAAAPYVDFADTTVAVVVFGPGTLVKRAEIHSIIRRENKLIITVVVSHFSPTSPRVAAVTSPYQIVRVATSALPHKFVVIDRR